MIQLQELTGYVIIFIVVAIVLGIGSTIVTNVEQNTCQATAGATWNTTPAQPICSNASTYALNASVNGLTGLDKISQWQPTLAIIVVAAVVIGVIGMFYMANRR